VHLRDCFKISMCMDKMFDQATPWYESDDGKKFGKSTLKSYLTECIYQLVLESQLPHKIVNLSFAITSSHIEVILL
jgi:hypothetical protein